MILKYVILKWCFCQTKNGTALGNCLVALNTVVSFTRQKQARLQLLTAMAEQLLIENKRSRDTETGVMNMQLGRLRDGRAANASLLSGASEDLRGWRQP